MCVVLIPLTFGQQIRVSVLEKANWPSQQSLVPSNCLSWSKIVAKFSLLYVNRSTNIAIVMVYFIQPFKGQIVSLQNLLTPIIF